MLLGFHSWSSHLYTWPAQLQFNFIFSDFFTSCFFKSSMLLSIAYKFWFYLSLWSWTSRSVSHMSARAEYRCPWWSFLYLGSNYILVLNCVHWAHTHSYAILIFSLRCLYSFLIVLLVCLNRTDSFFFNLLLFVFYFNKFGMPLSRVWIFWVKK